MHLARHLLDKIVRHARQVAPAECFGFLVGRPEGDGTVLRVIRGTNLARRPEQEYLMNPAEFVLVEDAAERDGWQVIGFYHSHPGGSLRPSAQDTAAFWTESTYLIVALSHGHEIGVSAWRLPSGATGAVARVELVLDDSDKTCGRGKDHLCEG